MSPSREAFPGMLCATTEVWCVADTGPRLSEGRDGAKAKGQNTGRVCMQRGGYLGGTGGEERDFSL